MDTKEDMIEEMDEMEDLSIDSKTEEPQAEETHIDIPIVESVIEEDILPAEAKEETMSENESEDENNNSEEVSDSKTLEENNDLDKEKDETAEELPKKSKVPAIVILSILLILDIAALVIYIIGIEKVISFIK